MNRTDRALQLAAGIGLLLLVLPLTLRHGTRASAVLQNFMHVPVFGLVTIAALRTLRAQRGATGWTAGMQYLAAWTISAAIGAASEIAQMPGPREASFEDWIVDCVSAATALAWYRQFDSTTPGSSRLRQGAGALALAGSAFLAFPVAQCAVAYGFRYHQLPDLVRFHGAALDAIDTYFLEDNPAHPVFRHLPEKWRKPDDPVGLRVHLPALRWPGLRVSEPFPDWTGFSTLRIDLTNPGTQPLELTLRIHDARHQNRYTDRFNQRITVPSRTRETVTIPLDTVRDGPQGRQMDMAHIAGLILFRTGPDREEEFHVTRIALDK